MRNEATAMKKIAFELLNLWVLVSFTEGTAAGIKYKLTFNYP